MTKKIFHLWYIWCTCITNKISFAGAIVFDSDEDEFYDAHSIGTSELQSQKEVFDKKQGTYMW